MVSLSLPAADGRLSTYTLEPASPFPSSMPPASTRIAYAAAHVVCDPLADTMSRAHIDWDATLAYRHHLWSLGLGVAEAMDTAQRGMGLDWQTSKELIQRSLAEARTRPGALIACGAGTDHLVPSAKTTLDEIIDAYQEQCALIEQAGGQVILMASRALASYARTPEEYARVYDAVLSHVQGPVIIHWLGEMFDPALSGYWGTRKLTMAMEYCLDIIRRHAAKIAGIKLSLLSAEHEISLRRRLPSRVHMYTGDDFNYPSLIRGDNTHYSDALLGIFDAIAPSAAGALHALDEGDIERYEAIFAPTVPLSRHIFQSPTYYYKTGIVFLAYLNGHQSHFRMVAGLESARSILHLAELFKLADQAHLLRDPELAVERMRRVLAVAGIV